VLLKESERPDSPGFTLCKQDVIAFSLCPTPRDVEDEESVATRRTTRSRARDQKHVCFGRVMELFEDPSGDVAVVKLKRLFV
jgi:hypothetical protein